MRSDSSMPPCIAAAQVLLRQHRRVVIAVSGGVDSMALLAAVADARDAGDSITIATYDHGTGPQARRAVRLVQRTAKQLGLPVRVGVARVPAETEAEWRRGRWSYLRYVAGDVRARIATAHTLDDHLETVVMRLLRGAGARGIAALLAPSPVLRPFVQLTRADVAQFATSRNLAWLTDPSNASPRHLRNRVRNEILPAVDAVVPDFRREMIALSLRAARLRVDVELAAESFVVGRAAGRGVLVDADSLGRLDEGSRALLWPPLMALSGLVADRRGIARLVAFDERARVGARIQLSAFGEVVRRPTTFLVRKRPALAAPSEGRSGASLHFGDWRFRAVSDTTIRQAASSAWSAMLPLDARIAVRAWRAGDRMSFRSTGEARRVKRFFQDARITAPEREGWPVVLVDDQIVWIPGIRRSSAVTERPGRPYVVYVCDRSAG